MVGGHSLTFEWYDFGAGWTSGMCGLLVGHPADTVKVRQQTTGGSALSVVINIFKHEGIVGFYKGLLMPLLAAGGVNSLFFGCYGNAVRYLAHMRDEKPKRSCCDTSHNRPTYKNFHWDIFLAGCIAGFFTTIGACPFEVGKIKMQTQYEQLKHCKGSNCIPKYSGSYDCLMKLYKAGGLRYIYKGLVPMLWRDVPTFGLYTLVYEHSLCECEQHLINDAPICIMLSGSFAGAASWAAVIPLDVVKSRIQADNPDNPKYKGMMDCVRQTYKAGGFRIFMTGFWVIMARAVPVNAATFVGYELFIKLYLKLAKEEKDKLVTKL